jgi:hypothetical protein
MSPQGRSEAACGLRDKADKIFLALKLEMADIDRAFEACAVGSMRHPAQTNRGGRHRLRWRS